MQHTAVDGGVHFNGMFILLFVHPETVACPRTPRGHLRWIWLTLACLQDTLGTPWDTSLPPRDMTPCPDIVPTTCLTMADHCVATDSQNGTN